MYLLTQSKHPHRVIHFARRRGEGEKTLCGKRQQPGWEWSASDGKLPKGKRMCRMCKREDYL